MSNVYDDTIGMRSQKHEGRHGPRKHESLFRCHEGFEACLVSCFMSCFMLRIHASCFFSCFMSCFMLCFLLHVMFASCVLLHVLRVSVHARSISHYRSRATRSLSHSRLRRRCTSLDALDVHGSVLVTRGSGQHCSPAGSLPWCIVPHCPTLYRLAFVGWWGCAKRLQ